MSFRNRCQIAGARGVLDLSIPLVKGRDQKTLVKDVKIADAYKWQDQHWKTLLASYSRSPWFEYYRDPLQELYSRPFRFLLDWNLACFEWTLKTLPWSVGVSLTNEYRQHYEETDWIDGRGKLLPKNTLPAEFRRGGSGASGSRIMSQEKSGGKIRYRQVFEERTGFIPNLSILDILFCEGKRARALLTDNPGTNNPGTNNLGTNNTGTGNTGTMDR